jgi:hypothetical protein
MTTWVVSPVITSPFWVMWLVTVTAMEVGTRGCRLGVTLVGAFGVIRVALAGAGRL